MGTIVVLKHELGTKREQYTCQKVHWEKSKEIHLHTARVLQKYNQALCALFKSSFWRGDVSETTEHMAISGP